MFRKRRRDSSEEVDDVGEPVRAVLEEALRWRDGCGLAFRLVHKLELQPERAILRLGKFDRVTCGALGGLREAVARAPGRYVLCSVEACMRDRSLALTLVRSSSGEAALRQRLRRAQPHQQQAEPAAARASAGAAPAPAPRLRVESPRLPEADRAAVEETLHRVACALGAGAAWRVVPRPADYHLVFTGAESAGERALEACPREGSHVDFEAGALVAVVPKTTPDIVF